MARWGMVIDMDKCTGCQACVVACKAENNVRVDGREAWEDGRSIEWIQLLNFPEGTYPNLRAKMRPIPCMQCDNPPCTPVCPVFATFKASDGIVGQIYARCIGCRYCLNACPYTCKFFNWSSPVWLQPMREGLNPDISVRPRGVVEKCLFCHHRLQQAKERAAAEERALRHEDYVTACAQACPAKAISFGDLENSEEEVAQLQHSPRRFVLQEDLGTKPKVSYLAQE